MASIDDVLKVLEDCHVKNVRRIPNPGKYHFSIGFGYPRNMNYDKLTRELESIGLEGSPTSTGITYRGRDCEVITKRPGSNTFNTPNPVPIIVLVSDGHEDVCKKYLETASG
jgi:hypothetical protein